MTQLLQAVLPTLTKIETFESQQACLTALSQVFYDCLGPDNVICFELVPETRGTLKRSPTVFGNLKREEEAGQILQTLSVRGMLSDFIRHWQVVLENDAPSWITLPGSRQTPDFSQFLQNEEIKAFIFLPIAYHAERYAAYFINYHDDMPHHLPDLKELEACTLLIGTYLQRQFQHGKKSVRRQKQMAVAHTLYGQAAIQFVGQVELLQAHLRSIFADEIPTAVVNQLNRVKHSVFSVMRDLVINAAGDMLVDFDNMSLGEALQATASALERAWPEGTTVQIDISRIPPLIEKQPLALKEILYTLILELIGNAIKHGGPASYISVEPVYHDYTIYLQVLDHGRGFELQEHGLSPHGLGFWQTYIEEYLNGSFHIASQPQFGTAVQVEIPVIL